MIAKHTARDDPVWRRAGHTHLAKLRLQIRLENQEGALVADLVAAAAAAGVSRTDGTEMGGTHQ